MIDHLTLGVRDIAASKRFYVEALKPLGIGIIVEFPAGVGLGSEGKPYFWLGTNDKIGIGHLAFTAKDRPTVDAFYQAAMAAGARDNGPPGIRSHYHPNYYGAFVFDPDGNNIEAVCHLPLKSAAAAKARPAARKAVKKVIKKKPAKKKSAPSKKSKKARRR
jgi:catechol 2,3-dioxygenase-like lactoylglutathione lyase family enzyme